MLILLYSLSALSAEKAPPPATNKAPGAAPNHAPKPAGEKTQPEERSHKDELESLQDAFEKNNDSRLKAVLKLIPANWALGFKEYMGVIGTEASSSRNKKIDVYNGRLTISNACYQRLLANFYSYLQRENVSYWVGDNGISKPTLDKEVTTGTSEPGSLWTAAMKFSGGDSNLAMHLIGFCGHDDIYSYKSLGSIDESLKKENNEWFENNKEIISNTIQKYCDKSKINITDCNTSKMNYESKIRATTAKCLDSNSVMFVPKSLGEKAALSKEQIERIAKVQAPNEGAKVIPAKYYHVLGAAFSSCMLARRGVPKWIAKRIVKGAINAYRAKVLCDKVSSQTGKAKGPIDWDEEAIENAIERFKLIQSRGEQCPIDFYKLQKTFQKGCRLVQDTNIRRLNDPDITPEIIRDKIIQRLSIKDLEYIFNQFRAGEFEQVMDEEGKMVKAPKKKQDLCAGPQLDTTVYDFLKEHSTLGDKNPCPSDWSAERCLSLRKKMATWAIDFEFSEAQHLAGLDFAYENCKELKDGEDPIKKSCELIEDKSLTPSATPIDEAQNQSTR